MRVEPDHGQPVLAGGQTFDRADVRATAAAEDERALRQIRGEGKVLLLERVGLDDRRSPDREARARPPPPSTRRRPPRPAALAPFPPDTHVRTSGTRIRARARPPCRSCSRDTSRAGDSRELLPERNGLVRDVHARTLVESRCAGGILGVDSEPDSSLAAAIELSEGMAQEREPQTRAYATGPARRAHRSSLRRLARRRSAAPRRSRLLRGR